ncbi:hypothetical protein IXO493_000245 [Xanthomonas oryzae pv. oryzae]|uniref:Uncharacterized protein n=1 Tax=Xanthomonas oryzae pv. oryzae TaxID=64187 RepID=A0AAJ5M9B3_XANOO|nr:hypothetical protein [Xanthomonas oryzae]QIE18212.1 hypothetical protein IXO704_000405 [Xanthomonas oryzae pv. oryzae]UXV77345.1 hypothetical protein IXO842_000240 [Xanthomonas oryzae pv. oryzae]UXV99932.1 hypothetical protein IXO792_00240 [Xanthomonas oryzae pv. oryzae]UXW18502.1 hypothetical protein IXO365_000245 [Xanthomonas oryzae pv. oryzae]UXW22308.1 hypothetical protein IXO493_000245 [Xanthomonas oryzae pv. oryzae]
MPILSGTAMKSTLITVSLLAMLCLTACDRPGGDASRTAPAVSPEPTAAPVSGSGATELVKDGLINAAGK